jgi:SAM-dependent methyltransferase
MIQPVSAPSRPASADWRHGPLLRRPEYHQQVTSTLLKRTAGVLASPSRVTRRLRKRLPGKIGPYVRTGPVSNSWGEDRGTPIARWYIDRFMAEHQGDIHGRVLEVKGDEYVTRFGHDIDRVDILDKYATNERATFVADLQDADVIPDATFDCFVLTQVLEYCLDPKAAAAQSARILKPGGVLLSTSSGINMNANEFEVYRYTEVGYRQVFESAFGEANVQIESHGNSLAATAGLTGLAAEELDETELTFLDRRFPVVHTCRAVRRA